MNCAHETPVKRKIAWLLATGLFLALFSFAGAQSVGGAETQAALEELAEKTGVRIATEEDARTTCNKEQYLSACIDVGKKYNLYDEARRRQVDEFLKEAKDEVVGELKSCRTEECLFEVAKKLAEKITKARPDLATALRLTPEEVKKKEAIGKTAQEARDRSSLLQDALRAGKYQCGDNTPEGCGNFCLNPGAETRAQGVAGIPAVCRQIAEEFYGPEGISSLEAAHKEVEETRKYFEEKRINKSFITHDGKKLYDPKEIGRYLEEQGKRGNTEAVARGMDYLIQYGFAKPEDKEFALKFVENIRQKGRVVNFEECVQNPGACAEFVPEDVRRTFSKTEEARQLVSEAMRSIGVPDPIYCANEEYGERCFEATKNILPKIEEMAAQFPEVQQLAADLRKHAEIGGQGIQARTKAKEELVKLGTLEIAGKEFSNWNEITEFCKINGSLCLADAARQGFIEKDVATEKYQTAFEIQYRAPSVEPKTAQATTTVRRATTQTLTAEKKEELLNEFKRWLENPIGPPPVPYGEASRSPSPYPFQERQTGTSYYITPEMEKCLAERGVRGEAIDILRKGGSVSDTAIQRSGAECAKDIALGKYEKGESELNLLPEGIESCLRSKGVREEDVRRMRRGEKVEIYLEEVKKLCYGEAPTQKEPPKPAEEDEGGLLKAITKPFEPIVKPFVGDLLEKERSLKIQYPYTFSDGFVANTRSDAEAHCKEYTPDSGRGISAECEAKIGVLYEETKREYVNWVKYTWTFADKSTESSYILDRKDSEYLNYLKDVKNQCLKIQKYKFRWKEKAGESAPENWKNFGIPDCSGSKVAEDACYTKYGPGWITKDTTKNCYDAYGSNFKTSEGKVYSCEAVPVGVSAPGCMKKTVEDAPKPIYGESPSDCSPVQYWDNNAKTCAIYTCPSGYAWSEGIRGCKNIKDSSPICPPSTYWNTARTACETLKCTPPQYWDARSESCKTTEIWQTEDTWPVYGNCRVNANSASCATQPGCVWYGTYCEGDNYRNTTACNYNGKCDYGESAGSCASDCGGGDVGRCGAYTTSASCSSGTNCSWYTARTSGETSYCYYSSGWGGSASSTSNNWVSHLWTFSNGTQPSSILNRTDKEYLDYIASVDAQCKTIKRENFCWRPGAGNQSEWKNFGIPDCSGTCSSGGTGGGSTTSTWGGGTVSSCSSALSALLGTGCHYMYSNSSGQAIYCDGPMTKSAKEGDSATTSGCSSSGSGGGGYAGDQNSCPGFAYSTWDSSGKRYCKLNTKESCQYNYPDYLKEENYASANCPSATTGGGGTGGGYSSCSATLKTLLGADCHWMYSGTDGKAIYCDGPMTKSAKEGDTTTTSGCSSSGTSGGGTGGGGSTACNNNGTCEYGESSGSCPTDCGTSGGGGSSSCTPALIALLGTGCHFMSTNTYCDGPMTKSAKEGDTTTTAGCSGGGGSYGGGACGTYTTQSGCAAVSGCAWDSASSFCYSSGSSGGNYTGGSYSSCSASLQALLGTGCHYMYNNSSGQAIYCDGPMTKSAKEGDAATTSGCSGSGGSYGGACGTYTTQSGCTAVSGCAWDSASSFCYSSGSSGGNYGSCGGYSTQSTCAGQTNCYWYSDANTGGGYCYYSSSGGAYGGEKKGFAIVLDAIKKIFWTLSY